MSGPFGSSQWMYNAGGGFYDYEIDNSLRFNDDDSAHLTRTPTSTGNQKTWTFSAWVKRSNLGITAHIFNPTRGGDGTNESSFRFLSDDRFDVYDSGTTRGRLITSAKFRDVGSWYHIVFVLDTTNATSTDRMKLYINGERVTAFDTYSAPSQNTDWGWNAAREHSIGSYNYGADYQFFDGYLAEVNHIDGTALDPTSFGETKSGIWIPKAYSGSYGTNGFHLEFAGNANDTSGNGNNFTANNISSHDYVPDSPTNNFCTLNGVTPYSTNISEGNLKGNTGNSNNPIISSFKLPNTGKWYWEVRVISSDELTIGIRKNSPNLLSAPQTHYYRYGPEGLRVEGNLKSPGVNNLSGGDIVGVAFNADDSEISWYHNGTLQNQAYALTDIEDLVAIVSQGSGSGDTWGHFNFGQDSTFAGSTTSGNNADANGIGDFKYAPPSGFLALCTANLPDPAIDPAADDTPEDYFNTVLYTGDGVGQSITGVGFQPDWTWIKCRSAASSHSVYDVNRGVYKALLTDSTSAELNLTGAVTSFTSDGFTLGTEGIVNTSARTYVAWNWKAGGTGVSNTDGSITSTVSANPDAGFSIVTYTGTGSAATVGHGLSQTPDMVIHKVRSVGTGWSVWHKDYPTPTTQLLELNQNFSLLSSSTYWNNSLPTSTTIPIGTYGGVNTSGGTHVAYCFHSVDGYSKFGKYTGNGSTDGTFVYTGFRPAFIIMKRTDAAANWIMVDNRRIGYNVENYDLSPDQSIAEEDNNRLDILSNGFKFRSSYGTGNTSGGSYIYMAFAEQPFKYANAR